MTPPLHPYIFHRAEGWYPLELANDLDAGLNAIANAGTLRVTDGLTGAQVWPVPETQSNTNGSSIAAEGETPPSNHEASAGRESWEKDTKRLDFLEKSHSQSYHVGVTGSDYWVVANDGGDTQRDRVYGKTLREAIDASLAQNDDAVHSEKEDFASGDNTDAVEAATSGDR